MMRLGGLILWDMRFQAKYGFYVLYAVLTGIYMTVILAVPEGWKDKTAAILIFSDPASLGLFFMGAIVLLEKSQRTPSALAVSPVRPMEYVIAKVISLSAVSLAVAAVLARAARVEHFRIMLLGVGLSSAIFTLLGLMIAANIDSLNQFILWTVPVELVCFVPAILHAFKLTPAWLRLVPVNVCMDMVLGVAPSAAGAFAVMALLIALFGLSKRCVLKMWSDIGGVKR